MNFTSTTTTGPWRAAAPIRTLMGAILIAGTLTAQSDPQQLEPVHANPGWASPSSAELEEQSVQVGDGIQEICFTSWYLRINEYLFDGREFKRFIAAGPAIGDGQLT